MKPLTKQHATDNNFTPIDCVRYFKPKYTDAECYTIIWKFTSYPFTYSKDLEDLINQLNKLFLKQ
jgi:hypothetical protein